MRVIDPFGSEYRSRIRRRRPRAARGRALFRAGVPNRNQERREVLLHRIADDHAPVTEPRDVAPLQLYGAASIA